MADVYCRTFQVEFYSDGGLRGVTAKFSDGSVVQSVVTDDDFTELLLAKMRASNLAKDLLEFKKRKEKK